LFVLLLFVLFFVLLLFVLLLFVLLLFVLLLLMFHRNVRVINISVVAHNGKTELCNSVM